MEYLDVNLQRFSHGLEVGWTHRGSRGRKSPSGVQSRAPMSGEGPGGGTKSAEVKCMYTICQPAAQQLTNAFVSYRMVR